MNKEKNDKNCVDLVFVTGEFVDSFQFVIETSLS